MNIFLEDLQTKALAVNFYSHKQISLIHYCFVLKVKVSSYSLLLIQDNLSSQIGRYQVFYFRSILVLYLWIYCVVVVDGSFSFGFQWWMCKIKVFDLTPQWMYFRILFTGTCWPYKKSKLGILRNTTYCMGSRVKKS